jgi:hypothetical protein
MGRARTQTGFGSFVVKGLLIQNNPECTQNASNNKG